MELNIREASSVLNVSEKTLIRWLKGRHLPAYRVNEQYRFNREELLDWASHRGVDVSPDIAPGLAASESSDSPLQRAFIVGGVFHRVPGDTKAAVLRQVVDTMNLPGDENRNDLYNILLTRESLGSSGIGGGIAIPHVRGPIVLQVSEPSITLSFLERPVDFGALDGAPVNTLFTLIAPTVKSHLNMLSRLAHALTDSEFKAIVARQGAPDEILAHARRADSIARPS